MPIGYTVFFTLIAINAIYLGTWSFSVVSGAIPLVNRIIGTFDLARRAGLWEMSGQICILCATAKISLVLIDVKETSIRSWRTVRLSKQEIITTIIGLILMLLGALIESYSIINQ
jgi:hypothetical protein